MRKFAKSLPFRLLIAITIGSVVGTFANETVMNVVGSIRHLGGQVIFFIIPLIVLGFVAPAVARMGRGASRLLGISTALSYGSLLVAGTFAAILGYQIIGQMTLADEVAQIRALPPLVFELSIPPALPILSALVMAVLLGLGVAWTKAERFGALLEEFNGLVTVLVRKIVINIMPVFISTIFAQLAFQGRLTQQLPAFAAIIGIIIAAQVVWIALLYLIATFVTRRNPWQVIRYYGAPFLTAIGTMSSSATMPVAVEAARKSPVLDQRAVGFAAPLFVYTHMSGAVVAITLSVLAISQFLNGSLPSVGTMVLYIVLLGVFAVASPGLPGGTAMASLGVATAVLGFDEVGTGLILVLFALGDSITTAANISGDGPLLMILSKIVGRSTFVDHAPSGGVAVSALPLAASTDATEDEVAVGLSVDRENVIPTYTGNESNLAQVK